MGRFGWSGRFLRLKLGVVMGALICVVSPNEAGARTSVGPACACAELFDALAAKVETNYPGYHLEVKGKPAEDSYRHHVDHMRRRSAEAVPGLDCLRVLQTYVAWFDEGHLFVGGRPRVSTAEDSVRLRAAAPRVEWSESDVLRYLEARRESLDEVEGIWYDASGLKLAVVRDDLGAPMRNDAQPTRFSAFVIQSTAAAWEPGDVKAQLELLPDGSYDAIVYDDVRAQTRPHVFKRGRAGAATLQRDGLLLHMPPLTWGKLYPIEPGQEGLVDPVDPRAPTARLLSGGTVVFRVPSNVPAHAARLRLLVEQYRGALARAGTLIIDLRGNEGGSTFVTDVFMPYLVTPEKRPARYMARGASAVIASPDNIRYFEGVSWAPARLVERLREASAGTLIPFSDPEERDSTQSQAQNPSADEATSHPREVAILTDAMTVSAAEAFVLKAMRNTKVTLFGEATGSSIDYQTMSIIGFGCPEAGLYLGYPVLVGSDQLPDGGVRPTGIVPDVPLDRAAGDPILRITEHYRQR